MRNPNEELRKTHPSGASATGGAALGPAQFQVRTSEAMLQFTYTRRIVDCGGLQRRRVLGELRIALWAPCY
eukprot:8414849-Alexandrium_andersonii.AAC.1